MRGIGITKLEHARTHQKMGVPLNTPVEEREFSKEYTRHWAKLVNAQRGFMWALGEFVAGPMYRDRKWRQVCRNLTHLDAVATRCIVKGRLHEIERALLREITRQRVIPFLEFWASVIDEVDRGEPVVLDLTGGPPWIEDEGLIEPGAMT